MNQEIKKIFKETGVKQWQVAQQLGIGESTLCRMMRVELSPNMKAAILEAVKVLRKEAV